MTISSISSRRQKPALISILPFVDCDRTNAIIWNCSNRRARAATEPPLALDLPISPSQKGYRSVDPCLHGREGKRHSVVILYNQENREDLAHDHSANCKCCERSLRDDGDCGIGEQLGLHALQRRVTNLGSAKMTSAHEPIMSQASMTNMFALAAEPSHVLVVLCLGCWLAVARHEPFSMV